jgi:lipid-A-disaccharide synthase-like uncharacterized protein
MNIDLRILFWNAIGLIGQGVFFSRFYVQWYATEKKKQVVVPVLFWWLSLAGTGLLLLYAIFYDGHRIIIAGYSLAWIPYVRNLVIHRRHKKAHQACPACGLSCAPQVKFCSECGTQLVPRTPLHPDAQITGK